MGKLRYIGKCLLVEEEIDRVVERVLVVGDLHLGYEESLNESGILVTRKMYDDMISYFDRVFEDVLRFGNIDRVVLLGDVKHYFSGITRQEWNDVLSLFDYLLGKVDEIIVVKGNHDNYLLNVVSKAPKTHAEGEGIAGKRNVRVDNYYVFGGYCFLHGHRDFPEIYKKSIGVWVMGHGHPAVKLREGVKEEKFKCFLDGKFRGRGVVLVPSFTDYNEGSDPREGEFMENWGFSLNKFEVRVVGEGLEVLSFGRLGGLE